MPKRSAEHLCRTPDLPSELFRHWVHSREEDEADLQVFRPPHFGFPPSFGREGFEMRPDGEFVQDDVGPADGIVQTRGRWTLEGSGRVVVRFGGKRPDHAFTLVDVSDERLEIRTAPARSSYPSAACADAAQLAPFESAPPASAFRLIDYVRADVVTLESFPPQYVLRVVGTKPYANMDVRLVPLVYVRRPDYWGIEVVGALHGIALPAERSYEVSLLVTSFLGDAGVEVTGATRQQKFDIEPLEG
ncbi:hypothetical protein ACI79C_23305 [Geodermatophilus sp. SYSU D00697]